MRPRRLFLVILMSALFFYGCSAGNGFHLRQPVQLASQYKQIRIEGLAVDGEFYKALKYTLQESGNSVIPPNETNKQASATTLLHIQNLREGKRVVAYTSERKAREYLLYLKFEYSFSDQSGKHANQASVQRINLDHSFLYDANFVLGKTEEERQIREKLYQEAARLIVLKMQYGEK